MMKTIKISHIFNLFFIFFIFSLALASCASTNKISRIQESSGEAVFSAPQIPVIPTQYTNINVVPDDSKLTEKELEKKAKKREQLKEETQYMSEEQRKFYYIKRTGDYEVIGEDLDYKIMVNHEHKQVIIQYEESDSKEDWHNNYLFFPWPLKLDKKVVWTTYGYAKIYKSSKNLPLNQFYEQIQKYPDYQVIIWGWSLGSAMAKITARHLTIRTSGKLMIDELTTFGDVKCWYNPFFSVKKYCKHIREYITPNDAIGGCVPVCRRDITCKVGEKWDIKKSRQCEYYHTHYEEYDYSKWE